MPAKRRRTMNTLPKSSKRTKVQSRGPLPVTLLSGFLGSGKTTLLQHILKSNHGLRIAVIVNDIGAINVDASSIQSTHRITKTKEKVIALQNGCICCTLRGDLLSELIELSEKHAFDYVIIESSGISEPAQVAESFDAGLSEHMLQMAQEAGDLDAKLEKALKKLHEAGSTGLAKFATLDTTVTVIDAFTMLSDFDTADFLSNRRSDVVPEDERTVSHLMIDQIEFADVIILNKTDMVKDEVLANIKDIVKTLNHRAKILCSSYGRVDVKEIINTGIFDLEVARTGAGWLSDLHEMMIRQVNGKNVVTPTPETDEYNVNNFIYSRHRPFHPERLMRFIHDKFILQLEHPEIEEDEVKDKSPEDASTSKKETHIRVSEDPDDSDCSIHSMESRHSSKDTAPTSPNSSRGQDKADLDLNEAEKDDLVQPSNEVILHNKRKNPLLARLFRSKGIFWLATRPDYQGSWSQAGAMLSLLSDTRWWCTLSNEQLSAVIPDEELMKQVQFDICADKEWGDRRQEIVFIGEKLERKGLEKLLDECLLRDDEWEEWQFNMKKVQGKQKRFLKLQEELEKAKKILTWELADGFPDWEAHFIDEEPEDDEEEDDHSHH